VAGADPLHITLLPFRHADAGELLGIFRDAEVRRYLLDDQLVSEDWLRGEIRASDERFARGSGGLWAIRLTGQSPIIGFVGFREFFQPPQLQLLYGLRPQYWHLGVATTAATLACEHAFSALHFDVIRAATDRPNTASVAVLRRLGMTEIPGMETGPADVLFLAVTREQWHARRATALASSRRT
jgi:ribosomal-protein-alanine N-acetyltransferase